MVIAFGLGCLDLWFVVLMQFGVFWMFGFGACGFGCCLVFSCCVVLDVILCCVLTFGLVLVVCRYGGCVSCLCLRAWMRGFWGA